MSKPVGELKKLVSLVDRGDVKDFALNVGALTATVGDVAVVNKEQFVIKL